MTKTTTEPTPLTTADTVSEFLQARGYRLYRCTGGEPDKHLFQRQPRLFPGGSLNIYQYDPGYLNWRAGSEPRFEVEVYAELRELDVSLIAKLYTLMAPDLMAHIDALEAIAGRLIGALRSPDTECR